MLINLGTNVVKMGHNQDEETERLGGAQGPRGCLLRSGGWTLFVLGSMMNFVSFSFAAQSLLAALGAVQFVANAVFARYCLREAVSRRTILATGGIIFGILMVISSASHRNTVHTVQELMDLYLATPYRAYLPARQPPAAVAPLHLAAADANSRARRLAVTVLYLLSSLLIGIGAHFSYNKLLLRHTSWSYSPYGDLELKSADPSTLGSSGSQHGSSGSLRDLESGSEASGGKPPDFDRIPALERMTLVFLYSIASAVVGTQSVLMAKCTSQIMRLQLGGESQFGSPFTMCALPLALCRAAAQPIHGSSLTRSITDLICHVSA